MVALNEIGDLVARANHILVTSHVSPDGDAVGGCLALGLALRKARKRVTVALADGVPSMFRFLPGWAEVIGAKPDLGGVDLIFALDLSDVDRIGALYDKALFTAVPIVNVDHHPTNALFGAINVVFSQAAATCELLPPIIRALGVEIDEEIAACLLTGLVSDTIGFRTPNTTSATLRMAADLIEHGAPVSAITEALFYTRPLPSVKLLGLSLSQLQERGRLIWTAVTKSMLVESGATLEDCENIITLIASVKDVDAAILFKEVGDGTVRISIRTSYRLDAGLICQRFGGGGHARAAGCGLRAALQTAQQTFLAYVEDALAS